MQVTIIGVERMEGVSKKTGNEYRIGRIHAILPAMPSKSPNGNVAGMQANIYEDVDIELIKKIEKTSFPFDAEMQIQDVMQYGQKKGIIVDIRPLQVRPDLQKLPVKKAEAGL